MKEVESKSPWVGKTITCEICNRSYIIEAGDELNPGHRSSMGSQSAHFIMPCNHRFYIPKSSVHVNTNQF